MTISSVVHRILFPAALALSTASALAAAPTAPASGDTLETVTVTAQRQAFRGDVPLAELPQNVQVIDSQTLEIQNVTKLDDMLDLASSVARQNTFGGLWDAFAIRGFAGDENTPTGYLVNGFNAGRGFSGRRDASNIERAEVLKGPGSALYGRAEPGGTINLVTKKPQFTPKGSIELAAGRYSKYRLAGDYTGPISDNVAFRINGAYDKADSFRDFVSSKKYALSPSLLAKFGSATTLTYELELLKQEAPFDRGIVAVNGALGAVSPNTFLGEPGDGDTVIKATGHQLVLQHDFSSNWSLLTGFGYRKSSFTGFSSDPELVAGRQAFYTNGTILARQRRFRDYDATDLTARAEISGRVEAGGVTHHLLTGIDYYSYELDTLQLRVRPTLANPYGINVFAPVYGQTRTPGTFQSLQENQHAVGFYLQDQIDLGEHWKVLAGVRYDDFKQRLADLNALSTSRQSPTATSPRAGLVYEFSKRASVYASYSKGFRPNSGQDAGGRAFVPELSKSYEIGTKLRTEDGSIDATIAIYKAKKSNFLTSDPINAGFSQAAGEAESKGLEIDVNGQLPADFRYNFSFAYTDAQISKAAADFNFGLPLPAGSRLINIPKTSGNLLLLRDFPLGKGKGMAGLGLTYVGDRLGETGVPSFTLPSYFLAKLTASYEPTDSLKITVDVDNLFDKTYYPSSYARLWVAPGAPRTWNVRGIFKF